MIVHIFDKEGKTQKRTEDRTPVCGKDFCDHCGDCLACFPDDPCYDGPFHFWVQYGEKDE